MIRAIPQCQGYGKISLALIRRVTGMFVLLLLIGLTMSPVLAISYSYDDLNRLTQVDFGGGNMVTYSYDELGNRVSLTAQTRPQPTLLVTPVDGLGPSGAPGGPFSPASVEYTLRNTGSVPIDWTVSKGHEWTSLSATSGTLPAGGITTVTASISASASDLKCGSFSDTITFTNGTNHSGDTTRTVDLSVGTPPGTYIAQTVPYDWIDPSGHDALTLGDDDASDAQAIPFSFTFCGNTYSQLYVGSNGLIGFTSENIRSWNNTTLPNPLLQNAIVCPYWDDLDPSQAGSIRFGTEGTAPNRKLVISWVGVPHHESPSSTLTFQVLLCETTSDIVFQYADVQSADADYGAGRSATVGIEDGTGTLATMYSCNGSSLLQNEQALMFTTNDTAPPTVSISAPSVPTTRSGPVSYTLNFSEKIAGLHASIIALEKTGSADATLEEPIGSGAGPYTVTLSNISGNGTLDIKLLSDAVTDMGCNTNAESALSTPVTVDNIPPAFLSITATPNPAQVGSQVTIGFAASEALITYPSVTVNGHPASKIGQSGLGYTYSYAVTPLDLNGSATIVIMGVDQAGNQGLLQDASSLSVDNPVSLIVTPSETLYSQGIPGGPFIPDDLSYQLTNNSVASIHWAATKTQDWVRLSATDGTLGPGETATVTISIDAAAGLLKCGTYSDVVTFTNETTHNGDMTRTANLSVHADGNRYLVQPANYDWVDPSGHAAVSLEDDDVSSAQPIPFNFTFYGNTYSQLYVGSNGLVGFADQNLRSWINTSLPNPIFPNAMICPYWGDLDPGQTGSIRLGTEGTAPNRKFVISWVGVPRHENPSVTLTFQVLLCETTNDIIFQYADVQPTDADYGAGRNATVGIEDATGALAALYSYNGGSLLQNEQAVMFTTNDTAPPTVSISGPSVPATKSGPVSYTLNFSEKIAGLCASGIGLDKTGDVDAVVEEPTGSGAGPYTVTLSNITGSGTLGIKLLADAVTDMACNLNVESAPSATVAVDSTAPTFTGISANPSHGRVGTAVTITFTASEALAGEPVVTVNGHPATRLLRSGLDYSYNYTVLSSDALGAATITISGTDLDGNQGVVQDTTALTIDEVAWQTIKAEGFDGDWPNDWQLYSNYTWYNDELMTWAPETYQYSGGSKGGWPQAQAVDPRIYWLIPAPQDSDPVVSEMIYGPFSLSDATDARITFQLKYALGSGDEIGWYVSDDGDNYSGYSITGGSHSSWSGKVFDLKAAGDLGNLCGKPQVWFMLYCSSDDVDESVDGPFIDDIRIEKYVPDCVPPIIVQQPKSLSVCVGEATTFCTTASGTEPFSYQWRRNGVAVATATSSCFTLPSISQADADSYDCVISNGCGSVTSNPAVLTVNPLPSAPSDAQASPSTACPSNTSVLTATVGAGETADWYAGSCDGSSVGTGASLSVSPLVTTTYYARARNASGCVSQNCASVTVTVRDAPSAPSSASVDHTDFCKGSYPKITLSASGGSGDELRWSTTCHGAVIGTGTSCQIDAPLITTTYYAWWHGACGDSECASTMVKVNALPDAPSNVTATPASLCDAGSVILSATAGGDVTIDWYKDSCDGPLIGTGTSVQVKDISSDTAYFARSRNTVTGCTSDTCTSVTVKVYSSPNIPASVSAEPSAICSGGSSTLSASVGANETVDWLVGSCTSTLAGSGASLQVTPSTTTTYYARTRNTEGGCVSAECVPVTITVVAKPSTPVDIKASPALICGSGGTVLSATAGTGEIIDWYSGSGGGTFVGSGNSLRVDSISSTTTYYARSRNTTTGCVSDQCGSVTVGVAQCYDVPAAKVLPDGSAVGIHGKVVSASFTDIFYIEEPDRAAGIRVKKSGHKLGVGTTVDIWGVMRTSSDGERYIDADGTGSGVPGSVLPLGLVGKSVGGSQFLDPVSGIGQQGIKAGTGLNNIGLLIRVYGRFRKIDDSTFVLDDGSATPLKCVLPSGSVLPPESSGWNYATATGISSCERAGTELNTLLRVRDDNDIQPY